MGSIPNIFTWKVGNILLVKKEKHGATVKVCTIAFNALPFFLWNILIFFFLKKDKQSFQLLDSSQLNSSTLQNQRFSSAIEERKETLRAEKQWRVSGKSDLFYFYYLFLMLCRNSHDKMKSRQTAVSVAHLLLRFIFLKKHFLVAV